MEKMADKSVTNILNSIEKSKDRPLPRVIFALGIPNIGEQTAELLAEHFTSIDELARASKEQLQEIPSIGPKIADSILAFFRQKQNQKIIDKLRKAGVKLEAEKAKRKDLPLAGLEFVITGRLEASPARKPKLKSRSWAAKPARMSPERPIIWWSAKTRAPSWPEPRRWAPRRLPRKNSWSF